MSVASSSPSGLTEMEAQLRLKAEGYNELPRADRRTPLRMIYLALGDMKEAVILLAFATMSIVITVVQETRTERVLAALRDLTSPRALVIRDGKRRRIAGREVVRGDIVVLGEGDRVPADALVVQCQDLSIDESLLTGESVPVRKVTSRSVEERRSGRPGGDDAPYVYSGSLVVRGTGAVEVTATGQRSEIGKIGRTLTGLKAEPPRLQLQTRKLVQVFAMAGLGVSLIAVILYGTLRGGWLEALFAGIALGRSMLPEEFPVVLTVFMAMGAWRISRAGVLTRRAAAIETLGSATVLCTDKTGTLTENRMSIAELRLADGSCLNRRQGARTEIPESFRALAQVGVLASAPEPFDPMERAFHELTAEVPRTGNLVLKRTYGLQSRLLAVTQAWQKEGSDEHVIAAKGAPESIADLCRLGVSERTRLLAMARAMAAEGLRVLALARGAFRGSHFPDSPRKFAFEYLGLAGLADPLRESVPTAIRACRSAGIRVVMITGDYPPTATAIAQQAGLDVSDVVTGAELAGLNDASLQERARSTNIFARIMPEQKLRIVNALKATGAVVAMTGDGVNDATSLKAAHIGIAMGGRGTDVAREASSLVLIDDDFGSIVKAVGLGRRIYDNIRKAMAFIFAVHVPIAGLALLPLAFGLPIIFGPIHVAFLEMIIDPVCSLVFEAEAEEENVMRRPPRAPGQALFSGSLIAWSLLPWPSRWWPVSLSSPISGACRPTRCARWSSSHWFWPSSA
jgi:P-type Ca2+ transporter type 2C